MITTKHRFYNIQDMYPTTNVYAFRVMLEEDKIPNIMLLHGVPGTGKTVTARIIAAHLLMLDDAYTKELVGRGNRAMITGYLEQNFNRKGYSADVIKLADQIEDALRTQLDIGDKSDKYVFILDEFTEAEKATQKKLVNLIDDEDASNVYMILTSNNVGNMDPSVLSRCTSYQFNGLTKDQGLKLLEDVAIKESMALTKSEAIQIYETVANGSPRDLLLALQSFSMSGDFEVVTPEREIGLVSAYITALNDIVAVKRLFIQKRERSESVTEKEEDESLTGAIFDLYTKLDALIRSKKTYKAITRSIVKYYDVNVRNRPYYDSMGIVSFILEVMRDHSETSYSYPFSEMLRVSYRFIEQRLYLTAGKTSQESRNEERNEHSRETD